MSARIARGFSPSMASALRSARSASAGRAEHLLVDAREREERGDARAGLLAALHDVLEGLGRLGPRALRDEELGEREERRDVVGRGLAHLAHRLDRHADVAHVVAGDARDLRAEQDDAPRGAWRGRARCGRRR